MCADTNWPPSPKAQLAQLGLSPRKALGQNFLIGHRVINTILRAAELNPSDLVLEIGPGLGIVTEQLVTQAGKVIALEMDPELANSLSGRVSDGHKLSVVCGDARQVDVCNLIGEDSYKLIGNLPYYAANPILRHFLESECRPTRIVVMLQREVAKSMTAQPGQMSLLSVGVQTYGKPRIAGYVPPSAFYPQPKVTSAVVSIDVYRTPALELEDRDAFFNVVRAGFSAPRKQIRNSLANGLGITFQEALGLLRKANIEPSRRAETLDLETWKALYEATKGELAHVCDGTCQDKPLS